MKTSTFNILLLIFGSYFLFSFSRQSDEAEKIIRKTFQVHPQTALHIINKHGNIEISHGKSKEINLEARIITNSGSKSARETFLKESSIDFSTQGHHIYAVSNPKQMNKGKYWWNRMLSSPVGYAIHYKVDVPANLELELDNKYGNIVMGDHTGIINLKNSYGNIEANHLEGQVTLDLRYGKAKITSIQDGKVKLAYSSLELEKAPTVEFNSKQSRVQVGESSDLSVFSKYDKYNIGTVNSLFNEGAYDNFKVSHVDRIKTITRYSTFDIEKCANKIESDMAYGSIKVHQISQDFTGGNIQTKYTNVSFKDLPNHQLSFKGKYTGLNLMDGYLFNEKITDGNDESIEAVFGENGKLPRLIVDMRYGKLNIN